MVLALLEVFLAEHMEGQSERMKTAMAWGIIGLTIAVIAVASYIGRHLPDPLP